MVCRFLTYQTCLHIHFTLLMLIEKSSLRINARYIGMLLTKPNSFSMPGNSRTVQKPLTWVYLGIGSFFNPGLRLLYRSS